MMRQYSYYPYALIRYKEGKMDGAIKDIETNWDKIFPDHVLNISFLDKEFDMLFQSEKQFESMLI